MNKIFKLRSGQEVNAIEHSKNVFKEKKDVTVYIGTDSQDSGGRSTYATVIAYRYGNKGVHYIYTKEVIPRIRDLFSRLYKETEYTLEIADWFRTEFPSAKIVVDLDYNVKPSEGSHALVASTKGWAEAMGLIAHIKLDWQDETVKYDVQVATKAADRECRGGSSKSKNRKKLRREFKKSKPE